MIYRILTCAIALLLAACEMTTEPALERDDVLSAEAATQQATPAPVQTEGEHNIELHSVHNPSAFRKTLAQVRAATAKYKRVEVAREDGYTPSHECVSLPGEGAMGVHFVNMSLIGDGTFDPTMPEVLVYEPRQGTGNPRLVAVEWVVFLDNMDDPGTPPDFFGHTFDGPSTHGLPPHYELHAWLWRHNPNGMFAMWNPKVSCPS